jgi:hypothetical protein
VLRVRVKGSGSRDREEISEHDADKLKSKAEGHERGGEGVRDGEDALGGG